MFSRIEGLLPYEKQTGKSQVGRPLLLGLILLLLAMLTALVVTLNALLIGPWSGPLTLLVLAVVTLRVERYGQTNGLLALRWRDWALRDEHPRVGVWLALGIGIALSVLALVAWPLRMDWDFRGQLLWLAYPSGSRAISMYWLWPVVVLIGGADVAYPFILSAIWKRFMLEIPWPNFADSVTAVRGRVAPEVGAPIVYTDMQEDAPSGAFGADDTNIRVH